jgi:hypothetical protein
MKVMKRFTFVTILVLLALLATISTAMTAESRTVFRTGSSGEAAVTGSDAHGNAIFIFKADGSSMKYKLVVNGRDNVTMVHIHAAKVPGFNGPPVLWLYQEAPPPSLIEATFKGLLGSRTVNMGDLTGAAGITSLTELVDAIEQGRAYVNVHASAFGGGEIRGIIQ